MHTLTTRLTLMTLLLGACDAVELDDAPDRGADAISPRWGATTMSGGSTRLNTGRLFVDGMPVHHFLQTGALVTYDDAATTQVAFKGIRLIDGGGVVRSYPVAFNTITVHQGRLVLNGILHDAGGLLGSEWQFMLKDSAHAPRNVTLKVTGVAIAVVPGGLEVPLYNFTLDAGSAFYSAGPYSACDELDALTESGVTTKSPEFIPPGQVNNFKTAFSATLYEDVRTDGDGTVANHDKMISLACASGALGKASLWGYPAWAPPFDGLLGVDQLQAATRAIRADYCGDGVSHTVDGTPIQIRDRFSSSFDDPAEATEAIWGRNGTECAVTDNRLGTPEMYACGGPVATTSCKELASDWLLGGELFMWTKVDPARTVLVPKKACNVADLAPGCADPGIEAVVCAADPFCCETAWDATCVDEVLSLSAASEACCADNGGVGCGAVAVSDCVSAVDSYCDTTRWDSICALEVEHLGCGLCR